MDCNSLLIRAGLELVILTDCTRQSVAPYSAWRSRRANEVTNLPSVNLTINQSHDLTRSRIRHQSISPLINLTVSRSHHLTLSPLSHHLTSPSHRYVTSEMVTFVTGQMVRFIAGEMVRSREASTVRCIGRQVMIANFN